MKLNCNGKLIGIFIRCDTEGIIEIFIPLLIKKSAQEKA